MGIERRAWLLYWPLPLRRVGHEALTSRVQRVAALVEETKAQD